MSTHSYIIVRRDLSPSQQAVQAAHAILEASRCGLITGDQPHPSLVLCSKSDEGGLLDQAACLTRSQIRFVLFREPDLDNQVTALATETLTAAQRRTLRDLRLLCF